MSNVLGDTKQQQVLAQGRLGWSLRHIEQATTVRRETASAYLKAAGIPVRERGGRLRVWPPKPATTPTEVSTDPGPSKPATTPEDHRLRPAKTGHFRGGVHRPEATVPTGTRANRECLLLGYRLAHESRWPEVDAVVKRLGTVELADRRVLAALVGERDKNIELALQGPVPVVGEGYRLMEAWLTDHFAKRNMPPPVAPEPFTGGLWTSFDMRGQAVVSKAFPMRNAPAWAIPLLAAADATAKIEPGPGNPSPFIGTGFLIGPRALALTDFIAKENPTAAVFGDERAVIEEVVGATNDDRHGALARIAPVGRVPLKIRWALPEVGTRIAVIGHPLITFTPTIVTLAAFTTYPTGEKMIMPGVIVAVEETKLTYECWTMGGVGGGPIIDLATGEVIGIHHSGKYEGGAKKLGFGVPVTAIEALLKMPI